MAVSPLYNEVGLFQQIAAGEQEAFKDVYYYYYPKLYGFVVSITKSAIITEEILQETFTRLWEHREMLADKGYSAPWLFRVAANLAYDAIRKAASESKLHELLIQFQANHHASNNVADHIDEWQQKGLLDEAIRQLPAQRQLIFRMSRIEGKSHQEIAEQLGISTNTVKNQMVTALKAVRSFIHNANKILLTILG
ncbi:RNA polymerase sigma-70 factor (ECF subfamily) [Chitinophaga skermanii]|uniref:RNA polymerase sigma-70 factor (ECF subfamily) n=1 Tax=Chitinophaga skermanii TaxID=331697 RepID=A0A327QWK5_9BACT|nr:RNA polymerase sigma-70 factor [Chitinophaga skermanii]RAJ08711.1 RNA polymerase sigma-70 factor (ECF subfamily) [Chitinophaga skermanii]